MAKAAAGKATEKKAPTKIVDTNCPEATRAVALHKEINELKTQTTLKTKEFEAVSTILKDRSMAVFNADIGEIGGESAPEVFGNHEYNSGEVVINFKSQAGGMNFRQIGKHNACEVLPKIMGEDNYKKLFTETPVLEEDASKLKEVADFRPDLVGWNFNPNNLTDEALAYLKEKYPDAFTPYIKDRALYAKDIPGAVIAVDVYTVPGFIEKVSSLPDSIRLAIKDLIRKVLSTMVTTAIKCGNKAD